MTVTTAMLEATADRLRAHNFGDLAKSCTASGLARKPGKEHMLHLVDAATVEVDVAGRRVVKRVHWSADIYSAAGSRWAIELHPLDVVELENAVANARDDAADFEQFVARTTKASKVPLRLEDPAAARRIADTLAE